MTLWNCSTLRPLATAALLVLFPMQSLAAAVPAKHAAQLEGDDRILHALNRLTFGPRPGDLEAVRREGLDHWMEQQLHPAGVDDSAFEQRLAQFPAMRLSQAELLRRFPDPQTLRMMARGSPVLPADPAERAIYRNGLFAEQEREQRKAEAQTAVAPGSGNASTGEGDGARTKPVRRPDFSGAAIGYSLPYGKKQAGATTRTDATGMQPAEAAQDAAMGSSPNSMGAAPAGLGEGRADAALHKERFYPKRDTLVLLALPPAQRLSRVLAMEPEPMSRFRQSLSKDELKRLADGLTPEQKETLAALGGANRVVVAELLQSRLERDLESKRQIEAVMTDFWLNHFNVYLRKNQIEPYLLPGFEREVRLHALGRFENLLVAVASSPAMLVYLDNAESIGPNSQAALAARHNGDAATTKKPKAASRGLNENYARELMELHTVGVRCEASLSHRPSDPSCGSGYTQADVTEVARVLTGWTVTRREEGSTATYIERRHEPGDKHVLGHTLHSSGEREGLELLHLLATSPATAQFLSTKLAMRFVSDDPPPSLIAQMTTAWRKSNGDISAVLRAMVHAPEFWSAAAERSKIKTPLEFVASAARASGAASSDGVSLVQALDRLGMPLYGMQTPNGYAWNAEPWVSTGALVARMNFALTFAAGRLPGTSVDWSRLVLDGSGPPPAARPIASAASPDVLDSQRLEMALLGRPASPRVALTLREQGKGTELTRRAEQSFLGHEAPPARAAAGPPSPPDRRVATIAGLLLGSPDFQRR